MQYERVSIFFLFILCVLAASGRIRPVAKFSFNNGISYDESNPKEEAKLVGIHFVEDRFGNDRHAVLLLGNESSYINLGTYKALKPKIGTISVWTQIEHPAWAGKGAYYNPIIITKNTELNDFYESYAIYYMLYSRRIVADIAEDSTRDLSISGRDLFTLNTWHHLVMSFDESHFSFYVDGQLMLTIKKNFEVKYLETDSVLVGATGNKKNNRWLQGAVDDIAIYDRVLTPDEISELYHAPNPNKKRIILWWVFITLLVLVFVLLVYFYIKHQVKTGIIKERQQLEQQNKLLETELRVNRASMNPHFVFNSLNTLHNFILKKEVENASSYLIKFSKLIRKTLDTNMNDTLPLEFEIELLERYLEIENLRFKENIKYKITVDESLVLSTMHIPVMMLQPFVENAIWHGLLHKKGEKTIDITFTSFESKYVYCRIEDNGTGRKKNVINNLGKKSLATTFISQRLDLLNRIHGLKCSLVIEDKPESKGTIVNLILPILS
jgi:hypothetical protein